MHDHRRADDCNTAAAICRIAANFAAVHGKGTAIAKQNTAAQFIVTICVITNDCSVLHCYLDTIVRQNAGAKLSRFIVL